MSHNNIFLFILTISLYATSSLINIPFNSFPLRTSNTYPNLTNTTLPLIEIIGPKVKEMIYQALSAFNGTNLTEMETFDDESIGAVDNLNITKQCYDSIYNAYFGKDEELNNFFLTKLIMDSSKNPDELSTYSSCISRTYGYNESYLKQIAYLEIILDKTIFDYEINSTNYEEKWSLFGICSINSCSDLEYSRFLIEAFYDLFELVNSIYQIEVLPINAINENEEFQFVFIIQLIPVLIIIFVFVMLLLKCIPFCCFKSCFLKSRTHSTENEKSSSSFSMDSSLSKINPKIYNRSEFKKFKISMTLSSNASELFGKGKYTNDAGMTYIKGVRGIAIILSILGFLFFVLFNSPISIYQEDTFINMSLNILFVLFFIGIRYAPRVLFSCSGFCLYYKLLCYLDEKSLEESQSRTQKKKQKRKIKKTQIGGVIIEEEVEEDDDDDDEEEEEANKHKKDNTLESNLKILTKDIKWMFLVKFYLYQIHKYVVFILIVLAIRYSIIPLETVISKSKGPIWNYYKEKIINVGFDIILQTFTLIQQFAITITDFENREIFVSYLWMIYAEMFFFLVGSLLIFMGYKYKYKFNYLFTFLAVIVLLTKGIFYITEFRTSNETNIPEEQQQFFTNTNETDINEDEFDWSLFKVKYQTLYYHLDGTSRLWNPFLNYIYYYIGTIFGAMNYVFQKKISYEVIVSSERTYLERAHSFTKFLNDKSKGGVYAISFSSLFIAIIFSFLQWIIMNIIGLENLSKEHCSQFIKSKIINFVFYYDIEIVVFCINLMAFGFYLKGGNFINNMFSNALWLIFEKMYFLIILFVNPVILYILSQIEVRITLNIYNALLYSLISIFFVLLFSCVFYICLELPLKKIFRVVINASLGGNANNELDNDDINEQINYMPITNNYDIN